MKPLRGSYQREYGRYDTPVPTARYMVEKVLPGTSPRTRIWDIAFGGGVFAKLLIENGIPPGNITAFDIEPKAVDEARRLGCHAAVQDSLSDFPGNFDVVIGNPAYGDNEHSYFKTHREELRRRFAPIHPTNLYALFLAQGIRHLEEDGTLCMILGDNFLTNVWYRPLRELILNTCEIQEILLAPHDLFHSEQADVRTCIMTLQKRSGPGFAIERKKNVMKLIDRISTQAEIVHPSRVQVENQGLYDLTPRRNFTVGVPREVISRVKEATLTIGDVASGGTGISSGNDREFLRPWSIELPKREWVPYYKGSGYKPFYYAPDFAIERDFRRSEQRASNFLVRNEQFFFREGLTTSSVGIRFSAAYLPEDCIFGMNTNLFFADRESLFYHIGLMNSEWFTYLVRAVFNRTNNVSAGTIKALPWWPPPADLKSGVAEISRATTEQLRKDPRHDFSSALAQINERIYSWLRLTEATQATVSEFAQNVRERL